MLNLKLFGGWWGLDVCELASEGLHHEEEYDDVCEDVVDAY